MANPLNGRVKRLKASAGVGETRYYALLPDPMNLEEWAALYCGGRDGNDRNVVEELKPLKARSYVRRMCKRLRSGPLENAIAEARQAPTGKTQPQFWVCSDRSELQALISELSNADSFSHVFVFTDLEDEMRLGPGRHRIDQ
jgi:hypothetical protein